MSGGPLPCHHSCHQDPTTKCKSPTIREVLSGIIRFHELIVEYRKRQAWLEMPYLSRNPDLPSLGMGFLGALPFTVSGVDVLRVIQKAPCVVYRLFVGDCVTSYFSLDLNYLCLDTACSPRRLDEVLRDDHHPTLRSSPITRASPPWPSNFAVLVTDGIHVKKTWISIAIATHPRYRSLRRCYHYCGVVSLPWDSTE